MKLSQFLRLSLVFVGLYYVYVGLNAYVAAILSGQPELCFQMGLTNSFLDACALAFGCGVIVTVVKNLRSQKYFIRVAAVLSAIAAVIQVIVFGLLFTRDHTTGEVLAYLIELIVCLFSTYVTIAAWRLQLTTRLAA